MIISIIHKLFGNVAQVFEPAKSRPEGVCPVQIALTTAIDRNLD